MDDGMTDLTGALGRQPKGREVMGEDLPKGRKILCFDFDGVLHSYSSGWQGATNIPDPPVKGAISYLLMAMREFDVYVYSSRSHQFGGRRAMKRWLHDQFAVWALRLLGGEYDSEKVKEFCDACSLVGYSPFPGDPSPDEECYDFATHAVRRISFPRHKPAAHYSIDDRGHQFDGVWPHLATIAGFKPWNRR